MTDAQEPRQDGPPQLGDDKPAKLELKIRHIDDRQLGFRVMYQPEDNNINVDIIAVHGIAADPDWTWTWTDSTRTSEVNWLSDMEMLPQALPHARILRFGYNSIWYGPEAVKQRLRSIAIGMLDELCDEREGCEDRPIIFIGHCFGGLVIQKAYNLAQTLTSDYPGISASTSGIVFMGTPHRGTGSALHSQGKIYQAVVRAQCETQGNILEVLEENNETLVDVVDEFTRLVHVATPKVEIVCFFEQMSTSVGKIVQDDDIKEFVVGEQSGVLRGHRSLGLPRDHFSLNKFSGKEDGNYKSVRRQLAKMTRIATESRSNSVPEDRKHLKDILSKMLQLVDHKKKLKDVSLRRPKGEQETWLTESQDFTNWMATPNSFAWLIGRVGAGKTLLNEAVISHLKKLCLESPKDTAVAYFFFQFDDTTTFDRDVFVKSLLAQLYDAMYLTSAARELENNMNQLDSDTNTELALRRFISACTGGAYIIIDGLDECPYSWSKTLESNQRKGQQGPRPSICDLLKTIRNWELDNLHLFLSSRDEKDIGTLMEETHLSNNAATAGVINMEKHRSKVDKVIGNLIDAKMKETRMKDSYLGEGSMSVNQFRQTLIEKADGVIFYASIQLDAILNAPPLRKEDLDRRLKTLPKDLYDTYEQALLRMPVSDTDFVYRIMVWQLFTAVPMTIDEVGEAVRIPLGTEEQFSGESEHSSQIKMEGRFPNPRALVKLIPGLLLTRLVNWADSDFRVTAAGSEPGEIVSVGHYSFMEYLTSGMAMKSNHEAVRKFAIDTEEMRIRMAVNCLRYFVHAASLLAQKVKLQQEIPTAIEIEKAFPLLELAIVNGLRLTEEMKYEKWTDSLKILLKTVLRTGPLFDFFRLLLNNTYEWDDNNFVPLTYLISEDMDCILSFILENNPPAIEEINTGLRIASSINKAGAVKLLLRHGANPFASWSNFDEPSQCAVDCTMNIDSYQALVALTEGWEGILSHCESLGHDHLRKAARKDCLNKSGGIVEILLQRGANPNHRNSPADIPIIYEAMLAGVPRGRESFFSRVTEINIDARDGCFGNALQCAVALWQVTTVSRLLLAGAAMDDPTEPAWEELLSRMASGASVNPRWFEADYFPDGEVAANRLRKFQEHFGERSRKRVHGDVQFAQDVEEFMEEELMKKEIIEEECELPSVPPCPS